MSGPIHSSGRSYEPILIKRGSGTTNLFAIHDESGSLLYAANLAPHLGPSVNLYVLSPLEGDECRTMEAFARRMMRSILRVQPEGPYHLCGYAFGGTLAYAIAADLLGNNKSVGSVSLIGADAPLSLRGDLLERFSARKCLNFHRDQDLLIACVANRERPLEELLPSVSRFRDMNFEDFVERLRRKGYLTPEVALMPLIRLRGHLKAIRPYYIAERDYLPVSLGIDVTFYLPSDETPWKSGQGWRLVVSAPHLKVHNLTETRLALTSEASLEVIGRILTQSLNYSDITLPESKPLYLLQRGKHAHPIFYCIPGAGSNIVSFLDFIDALGPNPEVYGLQPRGIDANCAPHTSVMAAAQHYLPHIRRTDSGKRILVGHSFGGWVAITLAALLEICGSPVSLVVLLDTVPPGSGKNPSNYDESTILYRWIQNIEKAAGASTGLDISDLNRLPDHTRRRRIAAALADLKILPARTDPDALIGPLRVYAANIRTEFVPARIYSGEALLLIAEESDSPFLEVVDGWSSWIGTLSSAKMPGNHFSMLKSPQVSHAINEIMALIQPIKH